MKLDPRSSHTIPDGHVLAEPHWDVPPPSELQRKRRIRNRALLITLTVLVALFYAITIAKMGG